MLLSLIYVSTATAFDPSGLTALTTDAATTNFAMGVTGMLAYNGRHFMQLLEGRPDAVEETMERIVADRRHENIVVIRREERELRECPYWGMVAMTVPLQGAGSAARIHATFPASFEPDTRVLFTSFASMARP